MRDTLKACLEDLESRIAPFMRAWERIVPFRDGINAHWGLLHKGQIMLRDDSAMNLSPDLFEEFVVPYNRRLLREFSGGADHFCGRGDHYIERLTSIEGLTGIAMSQPHLNDMEQIFRHTVDKGIPLLDFNRGAAEQALARGRDLKGRVHCA